MARTKKVNISASTAEPKSLEQTLIEKLEALERENEQLKNDITDNVGIRLDEYIEVMSLIPYTLNLSTDERGQGRHFKFTKFGEVKRILYNDLASIFEHYRSFMEAGYFYILNPKVVRKHGLDDIYGKLLTRDMMKQVIECDPKTAVKFYESATNVQRDTIDDMIIQALKDNAPTIDLNVVAQISKIAGKDLVQLANDAIKLESVAVQSN